MERREIGRSGPGRGVVGMGTWSTFDVPCSDSTEMAARREIVKPAIELGPFGSLGVMTWAQALLK